MRERPASARIHHPFALALCIGAAILVAIDLGSIAHVGLGMAPSAIRADAFAAVAFIAACLIGGTAIGRKRG